MANKYDVIVVGSGFGGAVTACRLAEKGLRVLVLERGRRWDPSKYPRTAHDPWIWDENRPQWLNGWLDLRCFPRMTVAQGAGVGGGSLIYANVVVDARKELFEQGWPSEITYQELRPYYERVALMLAISPLPKNQLTERFKLTREAAEKTGHGDRFRPLPLAITFDPQWHYGLQDPHSDDHSKAWTNPHGQQQGTCIHCGNCCLGCHVKAKNTLDLNYIPQAEKHGAEVRPLHLVQRLEPTDGEYQVHFDRLDRGKRIAGQERARYVILAAGSLSSTELLLRCRDQYRTLPKVSQFLGRNWSSNGDFLTPAIYRGRKVSPTQGPTISCAIDFLDGSQQGEKFFIEDGGFPNAIGNHFERHASTRGLNPKFRMILRAMGNLVSSGDPLHTVMPWFAQGIDAADGRLRLGRAWWAPWRRKLKLDWRFRNSRGTIEAIVSMHKQLAAAGGGVPMVPASWSLAKVLVTPHPLGGCNMGTSQDNGVVDHRGAVFGYPGLYVADGAIIPKAIGLNPSKTIAALAERIADHFEA